MSKQAQWISCKTQSSPINWFVSILSSFRKKATHPMGTSLDLPGTSGQRRSCLTSCQFCGWNSPLRLALIKGGPDFGYRPEFIINLQSWLINYLRARKIIFLTLEAKCWQNILSVLGFGYLCLISTECNHVYVHSLMFSSVHLKYLDNLC